MNVNSFLVRGAAGLAAVMTMGICNSAAALTIASEGKPKCVIVVASDATVADVTAGKELQKYLKQITGADFEVTSDAKTRPGYSRILLGQSDAAKKALPELDWDSLKHDGIVIKTVGKDLVLTGDRRRGTLYAVYTFLEDNLGCRWWTSTEEYVPSNPTINIGKIDRTYVPKIRIREAHYLDAYATSPFAAKLKVDGHFYKTSAEYGGHSPIVGWCHTFIDLLPPGEYMAAHPDWYAQVDGRPYANQLCLANDEMREELTKKALQWLAENPDAGMISISQNDDDGNPNHACHCPKCKAVYEEEGAISGAYVRFVNKVAEDIEKQYPNVLVETLAYQFTQTPPLHARPRKNVVIRLCLIGADVTEPINSEANKRYRDDVASWSKIAPNLYIWNYNANFSNYMLPHPNIQHYADNLRFYVAHNTIGMFEQGDYYCSAGDFCRLRAWLDSHLMWDPSLDQKKLEQSFLKGYYGAAAPFLSEYLDLTVAAVMRPGVGIHVNHDGDDFFTLDDLNQANQLFDKAEAAVASDPVLLGRVQRERLPLELVWLMRGPAMREQAKSDGKTYLGPTDFAAATDQFIAKAKHNNVTHWAEWNPFVNLENHLKSLVKPASN